MSCYHPLKAFEIGVKENGKKDLRIVPYLTDHLEFYDGSWHGSDVPMRSKKADRIRSEWIEVPCGQCIGCRLEYSRQWANRLMLELEYHNSAYFVTLTYNDDHIPKVYHSAYSETGEIDGISYSLSVDDCQRFMKRLRKHFGEGIRFFLAGEYGSTTFRPHYHAIIFGLQLDDLVPYKRSDQNFMYYTSESIQKVWSVYKKSSGDQPGYFDPIGFVVVAPVTWETCAYTARYVTKKLTGAEAGFYERFNLRPPFCIMSRRPGIARQWYEDHPCCMDYEYINLKTKDKGLKFRPPKYYEKLYEVEDPDRSKERKEVRAQLAKEAAAYQCMVTGKSRLEYLADAELQLKGRLKCLDRSQV